MKKVNKSSPSSHLFAQAAVSALALLDDHSAREALRDLVAQEGGNPVWVPARPREAVLVMGRHRQITPQTLFSFSRMRLVNLAAEFRRMNVVLSVQWVQSPA